MSARLDEGADERTVSYGPHRPPGPAWRARSALVVPIPAAERVVDRHRWHLDPSAASGLAAHVCLVSPFLAPHSVTRTELGCLAEAFRTAASFTTTFDQVRWFDEADPGGQAIWLAPVPEGPFVDLMHRAREAVGLPPLDASAVPHLIVGYRRHASLDELRIAAHQIGPELPVSAAVDQVALVATDGITTRWNALARFGLAVGTG